MISAKEVFVFMFPGIMYFWVFFIGQGPMQEILTERDTHTLHRLLASPVSLLQFLLSKMIRCFLLCGSIQLLLLVASALLAGVSWGDPFLLVPVILACALSVTGLLAAIYALAKTKEQAYSSSSGIVVVCGLLGGSFFPFEYFPPLLRAIGQFVPNRWAILALHTVAASRPGVNVVRPVVFLCAMGLLGSVTACVLFRHRLAAGGKL
jgi:ABC-2 type transport system permease protein